MLKQRMAGGRVWLVAALFVLPGCNREEPAATPQAQAPAQTTTAQEPGDPGGVETERSGSTPEARGERDETAAAASGEAAGETIAADLRRLADSRTLPEDWEAAQGRILAQGRDAVGVLAAGLSSDEPLEREMAATMLTVIGEGLEGAEMELRGALEDESAYVRANAATALCQLPETEDAVIPVLAELLASADPQLRQIAITNLGNFGVEAAPFVERLSGSLDDDRPEVVMPVVELLGRIGPAAESAAPKLRRIAFEQTGEVRAAAAAALEQIEAREGE